MDSTTIKSVVGDAWAIFNEKAPDVSAMGVEDDIREAAGSRSFVSDLLLAQLIREIRKLTEAIKQGGKS